MAAELVETSPALGPPERRDRPALGRAARRPPGQADLLRAALVEEARRGDGPRAGHAVRRPAGRRPARAARPASTRTLARELFIRHALVHGEWHTAAPVLRRPTGACSRRPRSSSTGRGGATSSSTSTRCSTSTTRACRPRWSPVRTSTPGGSRSAATRPDLLTFDPAMLVHDGRRRRRASDFPDAWHEGVADAAAELPLRARAARTTASRVDVPLATLNTVGDGAVHLARAGAARGAGHRADPVAAQAAAGQLRAGPRRRAALPGRRCRRGRSRCVEALARHLRALTGVHVPPDAWDWSKVPGPPAADLPGRRRGRAPRWRAARTSRQLKRAAAALLRRRRCRRPPPSPGSRRPARPRGPSARSSSPSPRCAPATRCTATRRWSTRAAPSACGSSPRAEEQAAQHRLGVRRLLVLAVPDPAPALLDGLDNAAKLGLAASPYPSGSALLDDCVLAAAGQLVDGSEPVRDEAAFERSWTVLAGSSPSCARVVLLQVLRVLGDWRPVEKALHGRVELALLPAMTDLRAQLGRLVARRLRRSRRAPTRCASTRATWPRCRRRIDRLGDRARDRELMDRVDRSRRPGSTGSTRSRRAGRPERPPPGAVAARGVPRQPLGPAARHPRAGLRHPDPEGAGLSAEPPEAVSLVN